VTQGKCYRVKNLRLRILEDSIIERACEALNGVERSMLVQEAVLAETSRLGIRWSGKRPAPLAAPWPYVPERDERTGIRVTVSVSVALAELISRAADHVHATEPQFIIGSTLAYVGRLQECFEATHEETREEVKAMVEDLQRIRLPPQYQYRGRRRG
jgi:hypothetical protein